MKLWKNHSSMLIRMRTLRKKLGLQKVVPFDEMQHFTKPGVYQVGALQMTPEEKDYQLVVTSNEDTGIAQALVRTEAKELTPEYVRHFDKRINRFRAFYNVNTGTRYRMEQYLDGFALRVQENIAEDSTNIGVITDTHDKDVDAIDFYGENGLQHVKEFNRLEQSGLLDVKTHLGDWIDGSDAGFISAERLVALRDAFASARTPYFNVKGNHDDNDKFDEHNDRFVSFADGEFESIMWPAMYRQPEIKYVTTKNGLGYYDKGDLRVIFINTSDVPYLVNENGIKKYDGKLTLAVREDQIEELIEVLSESSGKQILIMGHANLINKKGNNVLKYNGRTLHELLVAYNQRAKGHLHTSGVPEEFELHNGFDFSHIEDSRIFAYVCGHRHVEDQYRINGIQYVLLNCSALMGKGYALTTNYNKRWDRKIDHPADSAGYVLNVDLQRNILQVFGYGAASFRRVFRI